MSVEVVIDSSVDGIELNRPTSSVRVDSIAYNKQVYT